MYIPDKEIFTTGDVAKILGINPRTAAKLIDRGDIRGYRMPGSLDRRVARKGLLAYLATKEKP